MTRTGVSRRRRGRVSFSLSPFVGVVVAAVVIVVFVAVPFAVLSGWLRHGSKSSPSHSLAPSLVVVDGSCCEDQVFLLFEKHARSPDRTFILRIIEYGPRPYDHTIILPYANMTI